MHRNREPLILAPVGFGVTLLLVLSALASGGLPASTYAAPFNGTAHGWVFRTGAQGKGCGLNGAFESQLTFNSTTGVGRVAQYAYSYPCANGVQEVHSIECYLSYNSSKFTATSTKTDTVEANWSIDAYLSVSAVWGGPKNVSDALAVVSFGVNLYDFTTKTFEGAAAYGIYVYVSGRNATQTDWSRQFIELDWNYSLVKGNAYNFRTWVETRTWTKTYGPACTTSPTTRCNGTAGNVDQARAEIEHAYPGGKTVTPLLATLNWISY